MNPSDWISLDDAFDDCVNRLHAGQSVDDCLRAYPQHAVVLRGLLDMARRVRQANPPVPAGARARVWAQVAPSVKLRRAAYSWPARVALVASVALVVLVLVLLARRDDDPDHPLTVIPLATSTATLSETSTVTVTATATPSLTPTVSITPTLSLAVSPSSTPTPVPTVFATPDLVCLFTVEASSVNLRHGPGTGYGVAAYGFSGDQFPVTARHSSGLWFQVTVSGAEVWVSAGVGALSGDCAALPVSTLSLQDGGQPGVTATSVPGGAEDGGGSATEVGDDAGDSLDDSADDHGGDSGHDGQDDSGSDDSGDESD